MATESRHHRGQADQCDIKTKHKIKDKKSRNQERGPVVYTTNGKYLSQHTQQVPITHEDTVTEISQRTGTDHCQMKTLLTRTK